MLDNKIEQKEWIFYNIEKHSKLDYYKIEDLHSHKYANRVDFHFCTSVSTYSYELLTESRCEIARSISF
jgi:hypothetical protein